MNQYKRIFIVGHSGAGKGVLAQGVAKALSWTFIDMDFALEPSIGRSMTDIIGKQGQEMFYDCEHDILSHQISKENIVVTTGDSIMCHDKNRQLLSSEFVVYLKVSTPVQMARMSHNRPLLPVADYKVFLDKMHHERDALYESVSSLMVNTDDNDLESHIAQVAQAIANQIHGR